MKTSRIIFLALFAVALMASVAMGRVKPGNHDNFTAVFVSTTGNFRIFSIINTGANEVFVRFAYGGNAISNLTTDSIGVPVGSSWTPPNQGDIGQTARAYWLSSVLSSVRLTYD